MLKRPYLIWGAPMDRISIINHFIVKNGYCSYLEVGVREGHTFAQINCEYKASVDPAYNPTYKMTSDEYFDTHPDHRYDLIFIDGLHLAEQFVKDVHNALGILNPGGTIICHDVLPRQKDWAGPTQFVSKWCGTVWLGWAHLRMNEPNLQMIAVDTDYGIGIIAPGFQNVYPQQDSITWEQYINNKQITNAISEEEFIVIYG